ncbi:hypothetical protein, partial [Acinetobacter indicus]|uniref:hypothetical protein n=1 Tax=Acinetobacter indicus TaxID=756892 RepID=UPI002574B2F2
LLALMVVWGYPCESKSSPAHYSKSPELKQQGDFFMGKIYLGFLILFKVAFDFLLFLPASI